jgi:hypothetical protein
MGVSKMAKIIPISKACEALSALADKRIEKISDSRFLVTSSDFFKKYTVIKEKDSFSSNDNATFWQHYAGYPIIAVLLLEKELTFDDKWLPYFKGINWKKLNTDHHNKYDESIAEAFKNLNENDRNSLLKECQKILDDLQALNLNIKGNRQKLILLKDTH